MLPVILRTVALGAVGYGIKLCMENDKCIENIDKNVRKVIEIYTKWMDRFEAYKTGDNPQNNNRKESKE